jgi:excisionase family DNA binding protein
VFENLPNIVTVKELSDYLKIHESTIKRALKSGDLKGFKVTRDWRIPKEAITQWINAKNEKG